MSTWFPWMMSSIYKVQENLIFLTFQEFQYESKISCYLHIADGISLEVHTDLNQVWTRTMAVVQAFSSMMGL